MEIINKDEVLNISQEECAEVIQAISKIKRFGLDSVYDGKTNKEHLEDEVGDVLCFFEMLEEIGFIDMNVVKDRILAKRVKLELNSPIFNKQ